MLQMPDDAEAPQDMASACHQLLDALDRVRAWVGRRWWLGTWIQRGVISTEVFHAGPLRSYALGVLAADGFEFSHGSRKTAQPRKLLKLLGAAKHLGQPRAHDQQSVARELAGWSPTQDASKGIGLTWRGDELPAAVAWQRGLDQVSALMSQSEQPPLHQP